MNKDKASIFYGYDDISTQDTSYGLGWGTGFKPRREIILEETELMQLTLLMMTLQSLALHLMKVKNSSSNSHSL